MKIVNNTLDWINVLSFSTENLNNFQVDIDRFYDWCVNNRLKVNIWKCTKINFTSCELMRFLIKVSVINF